MILQLRAYSKENLNSDMILAIANLNRVRNHWKIPQRPLIRKIGCSGVKTLMRKSAKTETRLHLGLATVKCKKKC